MKKSYLLIFLSIILSGCLNYEQITTIYGNKSGKMFIHYWTNSLQLSDSSISQNIPIFNKETILNEFSSKHIDNINIEIYKDLSDSSVHAKIEFRFDNIDSLKQSKAFRNSGISIKELPDGNEVFNQFVQPFIIGFGFDPKEYQLKFVYYLPGKILKHNADKLSGHKLTWQFTMDDIKAGKMLSATFEPYPLERTPLIIYLLAGIVLLIVFFYLFRKRSG